MMMIIQGVTGCTMLYIRFQGDPGEYLDGGRPGLKGDPGIPGNNGLPVCINNIIMIYHFSLPTSSNVSCLCFTFFSALVEEILSRVSRMSICPWTIEHCMECSVLGSYRIYLDDIYGNGMWIIWDMFIMKLLEIKTSHWVVWERLMKLHFNWNKSINLGCKASR